MLVVLGVAIVKLPTYEAVEPGVTRLIVVPGVASDSAVVNEQGDASEHATEVVGVAVA